LFTHNGALWFIIETVAKDTNLKTNFINSGDKTMNIQRQARSLVAKDRQRNQNRNQAMLTRSVEQVNQENKMKENLQ